MNIGMIGVGLMGHGIARNIIKNADYKLTFLRHPGNQSTIDLEAAGATGTDDIAHLVSRADIIILCVTGAVEVDAILFNPGGVSAHIRAGQTVLDCSTGLPEKTKNFASRLARHSVHFADAAMTRTPKEAREGRLNLIVGADKEIFEYLKPLMACFAEIITHAGDIGSGQALKLIHNYVSLGFAAILAEAAAQAERSGIEAKTLIDILDAGGGKSIVLERFRPYLTNRDSSALEFTLSNAAKDIGYFIQAHSDSPLSSALLETYCRAVDVGGPHRAVPELVDIIIKEKNND